MTIDNRKRGMRHPKNRQRSLPLKVQNETREFQHLGACFVIQEARKDAKCHHMTEDDMNFFASPMRMTTTTTKTVSLPLCSTKLIFGSLHYQELVAFLPKVVKIEPFLSVAMKSLEECCIHHPLSPVCMPGQLNERF